MRDTESMNNMLYNELNYLLVGHIPEGYCFRPLGEIISSTLLGKGLLVAHQNWISVAHPGNGGMRHRHLATKIYFCGARRWCATEMSRFCGALSGVRHRNISVAHKSLRAPQNCMRHRKKKMRHRIVYYRTFPVMPRNTPGRYYRIFPGSTG